MKKAIIALLTTILAAFGYVVVDKTTDSRLATLESQVSSQQEVIESLHNIGKYSTRIQVTVSEGSKNKEVSIKITLPSRASTLSFEVFVNNEKQESKDVLMDGTNYTFKVSGKEANTPVKVRIDGDDYYTCTVDFSKDNPTISNQSYTQGASIGYSTVPNVTNLPLEEAKNKLKSEGFNNIKVVYETTADATKDGKVTKVNYTQGLIRDDYISVNSLITLTVAQADGIAASAPTTAAR